MRILFIPFDTFNLKSNEHIPNRIRLLSSRNELIGVKRDAPFTKKLAGFLAYVKGINYAIKVLLFGLRHHKDFDLIYCFEGFYALIGIALSILTGKSCIRDTAGVTSEWIRRVGPSRFFAFTALIAERITTKFIKSLMTLSEVDKQTYIKQGINADKVIVAPLSVDASLVGEVAADKESLRRRLGFEINKKILIFTGKRDYPPNMKAADWINKELAPAISKKFNDAQILMTGSGKTPKLVHPVVSFTGFVPNLFEYILASDICIAPIEQPSGVLVKVLDAMSCGRPVVVMASLTNGIPHLVDGENAMVAKSKSEFIEKTLYLLEHPEISQKIGEEGKKTIEEHYNWNKWEKKLNEILEKCVRERLDKH